VCGLGRFQASSSQQTEHQLSVIRLTVLIMVPGLASTAFLLISLS